MKKYIAIAIGITLILFLLSQNQSLPHSFTIKMDSDGTSGGATRLYEASGVYKGSNLISGTARYYVGDRDGNEFNYKCTYASTTKWIDANSSGMCQIPDYINLPPINKSELIIQIRSNLITPKEECGHNDTCYAIFK